MSLARKLLRGSATNSLVFVPAATGTVIGNLTGLSGNAACFNGTTNENGAQTAGTGSGYIGKTYSPGKVFGSMNTYGSNAGGYCNGANPSVTLNVRGKVGAAPSGPTDGTIIGTSGAFTDTAVTDPRTIASTDLVNVWDHIFLEIVQATNKSACAEVEIYEWA